MPRDRAGMIISSKKGRILLVLGVGSRGSSRSRGVWSFPKGHVENNETLEQTAEREVKEETNLTIDLDENCPFWNTSKARYFFTDTSKIVGKPRIKVQESEIIKYCWFTIQEIGQFEKGEANGDVRKFASMKKHIDMFNSMRMRRGVPTPTSSKMSAPNRVGSVVA